MCAFGAKLTRRLCPTLLRRPSASYSAVVSKRVISMSRLPFGSSSSSSESSSALAAKPTAGPDEDARGLRDDRRPLLCPCGGSVRDESPAGALFEATRLERSVVWACASDQAASRAEVSLGTMAMVWLPSFWKAGMALRMDRRGC